MFLVSLFESVLKSNQKRLFDELEEKKRDISKLI